MDSVPRLAVVNRDECVTLAMFNEVNHGGTTHGAHGTSSIGDPVGRNASSVNSVSRVSPWLIVAGEWRGARSERPDHRTVAPPQLEPAPAVQPKQCGPTTIGRPSSVSRSMSKIVPPLAIGSSIIWLKSQS